MGHAAKRKNQKHDFKRQQKLEPQKRLIQLPRNLDERHRPMVEALWNIPAIAELFNKVKRLPPIDYSLSPDALDLIQAFEQLASRRYQMETDETLRQAWADAPAIALEMATNLHMINWLAVGDKVPQVISRKSLEHGIELAHHNLTSGEWRVAPFGMAIER